MSILTIPPSANAIRKPWPWLWAVFILLIAAGSLLWLMPPGQPPEARPEGMPYGVRQVARTPISPEPPDEPDSGTGCNNNGVCEPENEEATWNCGDCPSTCGDQICAAYEVDTCCGEGQDCTAAITCGDGLCSACESSTSCAADCPAGITDMPGYQVATLVFTPPPPATVAATPPLATPTPTVIPPGCGDAVCQNMEYEYCSIDCGVCGNGVCEWKAGFERYATCPQDCKNEWGDACPGICYGPGAFALIGMSFGPLRFLWRRTTRKGWQRRPDQGE